MVHFRLRRLAALTLCILLVCLPVPGGLASQQQPWPIEDNRVVRTTSAVLYYLNADSRRLVPVVRQVNIMNNETLLEVLVDELAKPIAGGLLSALPANADIHLLSLEQSEQVATVNVGGLFDRLESFERFALKAAIVNTLVETKEVRYVNVLFNGRDWSDNELPTGTMSRFDEDLNSMWGEYLNAYSQARQAGSYTRNVTLYFMSNSSPLLVAEVRPISFTWNDAVTPILEELLRGPRDATRMKRSLPPTVTLLDPPEFINYLSVGETQDNLRCVSLNFSYDLQRALAENVQDYDRILGSLVTTLTTYLPRLYGVQIRRNRRDISQVGEAQQDAAPTYYLRSQYDWLIGRSVTLYIPRQDGRLKPVTRTVSQSQSTLRHWVQLLMDGPQEGEDELLPVFPTGFNGDSLRGLALVGDTALFNLTQQGAQLLGSLTDEEARSMVFAVVNTLTGFSGVRRVQFLVEGCKVRNLCGQIDFREPLLRNPGLIQQTLR